MSAHTPGPWHSSRVSERSWNVAVYTESGDEIALIKVKSALSGPRRDADAALIAAAPDLLAVLRRIVTSVPYGHSHNETFARARAAIAKAEGRA